MSDESPHEQLYLAVLQDIVRRVGIAADAVKQVVSDPGGKNNFVGCEVTVIQIRKVCEGLLLGATACHLIDEKNDISDNKWRPKDAFRELDQINEHALPIPVEVKLHHNGPGHHHIIPKSKPMPYSLLSTIYGVCGDLLHVPTIWQVLKGKLPEYDLGKISGWIIGFSELFRGHALMMPKREMIMLCTWSGNFEDNPSVIRMEAEGESTLDVSALAEFDLFK